MWIGLWIGLLLYFWDLVAFLGLKEDYIFYIFGFWTLDFEDFEKCNC